MILSLPTDGHNRSQVAPDGENGILLAGDSSQEAIILASSQNSESNLDACARRPVILGEVLFDCFPDGERVLGGAPFNVAWNLQGLGLCPLFLSACGDDREGAEIRRRSAQWGLDLAGIQSVPGKPTGRVTVTFSEGEPAYSIDTEQAYDYFDIGQTSAGVLAELSTATVFYHGSLAWRHPVSRESIQHIRHHFRPATFVDLNIRQPWFDRAWLPELLNDVKWLKLNVQELSEIGRVKIGADAHCDQIVAAVVALRQQYSFSEALVTAGSRGAFAVDAEDQCWFARSPTVDEAVDTVGAGDAFSAMAIAQLTTGKTADAVLQSSVEFAASACTIMGATSNLKSHYLKFLPSETNRDSAVKEDPAQSN